MAVLRVDAHFTVVESALKGYVKWKALQEEDHLEVRSSLATYDDWETLTRSRCSKSPRWRPTSRHGATVS